MTCREVFYQKHSDMDPEYAAKMFRASCPDDFGYAEEPDYCIGSDVDGHCIECWAREYVPKENNDDISEKGCEEKMEPMIKDSGERTEFATGARRDMHAGKGDMVSLPNAAILRLSKHYENGALKYGRWNYTKGIPVSSFLDSALRHLFKYLDGWDDEDHLSAAAFNVLGAMEMEAHHKELIDIPNRKDKDCFDYARE